MLARLIQMQAPPGDFDEVLDTIRERVAPAVRQLPGFRADYFAGERGAGRIISFVLFDGSEGVDAAEALFAKLRPAVEQRGVRFESVENLEVLVGA